MKKREKDIWKKRIFALIIGLTVVAFWRGVWGLLDLYLFPNNYELSLWISFGVGILVLLSLQRLVKQWLY